ncbi:MAG: biotin--[acetyl-CoA-carboxylase] ligase [[Chlorobium] sp. 445]|nr:MAG: biotin--[acetyl-CoA-carboxylase] ligase [[Chlorobium] sp. 445]
MACATHYCIGKHILVYDEIDSTNTEAFRLGDLSEGSVLIADFQTQGKGRAGKRWQAEKGKNILMSVVLRPRTHGANLGLLSLLAAEAVAETVEHLTQLPTEIKYPNDVVVLNKKNCWSLGRSTQQFNTDAHRGAWHRLECQSNCVRRSVAGHITQIAHSARL